MRAGLVGLVAASAVAGVVAGLAAATAGAGSRAVSATALVYPDDMNIRYTEHAHASVTHAAALFACRTAAPIARPGTRINFRTDATRVSIVLTYTFACNALAAGSSRSSETDACFRIPTTRACAVRDESR